MKNSDFKFWKILILNLFKVYLNSFLGLPVDIARINIDTTIDDRTTSIGNNNSKTKIGRIQSRHGNIMAVSRGGNFNVTVPFIAQIYEG